MRKKFKFQLGFKILHGLAPFKLGELPAGELELVLKQQDALAGFFDETFQVITTNAGVG